MVIAGFDNTKYLKEQTLYILERAKQFGNKLYLEFGGKLMYDLHAARVLPGYDPNVKMQLLQKMKEKIDIVICVHAGDIERRKIRADFGISYDQATLKLIDDLRQWSLEVTAVVITRYEKHPSVIQFKRILENNNVPVYTHEKIMGYPNNVDHIVSDEGYGANVYIETKKPIVVVTGPGPGSGKMATCLSQLYHENKRGVKSGYAKFETFPIWNLALKHPLNVAYEAATADLGDSNQIDSYHLDAYGIKSVNYNRDIASFPVLNKILQRLTGNGIQYRSPTDMGVNRVGFAITDDDIVKDAAKKEIIRRYFSYHCQYAAGKTEKETTHRIDLLLEQIGIAPTDRKVVEASREAAKIAVKKEKGKDGVFSGAAIENKKGEIITGTNSPLLHASSAVILNTIKNLAGIPKEIHLLSPNILESIKEMKNDLGSSSDASLNLEETLIALSISGLTNPSAKIATEKLKELKNCEMHLTHLPTPGDEAGLRKLGVNLTSDPIFAGKNLFLE